MIDSEGNYFSFRMLSHNPKPYMSPQAFFVGKTWAKRWNFFRHQSPKDFIIDIIFREAKTMDFFSLDPDQRKRYKIWLILLRMPLGIHANEVSKTVIASKTDFPTTRWPTRDIHLLYQERSLFSTFAHSNCQSFLLEIFTFRMNPNFIPSLFALAEVPRIMEMCEF